MQFPKSINPISKNLPHNRFIESFISTVKSSGLDDRSFLSQSLAQMDKTLSKIYSRENYDPKLVERQVFGKQSQSERFALPKSNTLTDALIRNTLGCDEKYTKQYTQLIDQTSQQQLKKNRIDQIKKKFTSSNAFNDISANSKPFGSIVRMESLDRKPVVDNEHEGYLKTQLIFLEKPANKRVAEKHYYEKHYDTITNKIEELGGMEDTISKMEDTLKKNQMNSVKQRETLNQKTIFSKTINFTHSVQFSNSSHMKKDSSWIEKSKKMRQQLKSKLTKM